MTTRRIKKDEADVQSMINTITEKIVNSWEFDPENTEKDPLLNIATGLGPPPDVAKSLLTAKKQGQQATNDFIDHNLASDEKSSWASITKMKLKTFSSLSKSLKSAKSKKKQTVINAHRQLWNRLAIASKSRDIDFKDVLPYELLSVPLSLSTLDGSLRKPNKAVLLYELEIERETVIEHQRFQGQTATILDLMALLQSLTKGKKTTFGHLSCFECIKLRESYPCHTRSV